jgi:allantoinase
MSSRERAIQSNRVVLPDGVRPAAIFVRDGVIAGLGAPGEFARAMTLDFDDSVIMPGIVDTHVHINEPGRTTWEGFETATMAAAAGGVTTIIEMPLNSIPAVTTGKALQQKISAAEGKLFVDVGFWSGVVPGNSAELGEMYEAGAFGFKCFLVPSGVPEFEFVRESDLRQAIPELARLGAVLLVHAELPEPIDQAMERAKGREPKHYATWLDSRPCQAEVEAIELLVRLAEEYKARIHIVHLSSASALGKIRSAQQRNVRITTETCPHYLTIAAEEIPDGATEFKCAPPIRERSNQEQLWEALREGPIDFIVTDHSPAPPETKCIDSGDFMRAWGGIASLQLSLPLVWTGARQRGFNLNDVSNRLCGSPAKFAGLPRKGEIKPGNDADFVVWDPEDSFQVNPEMLFFRHKLTPYIGRTLYGVVRSTFVRGREMYASGNFPSGRRGRVLRRGEQIASR